LKLHRLVPSSSSLFDGEVFYQLCNTNSTPRFSVDDADDTTIPSRIDRTMKELQNEPPTVAAGSAIPSRIDRTMKELQNEPPTVV
jgi:hypothetical protein